MEEVGVLAYLATSLAVKMIISYLHGGRKKKLVGKVSDLYVFPVKSCRGIRVKEAECSHAGLVTTGTQFSVKDRHWMVTTSGYEPITLMDYPQSSLITVEMSSDGLILSAPSMANIDVPFIIPSAREVTAFVQGDEIQGLDCGDYVADWLEKHYGVAGLRLVYSAPHLPKVARTHYREKLGKDAAVAYAWSTPISLLCEASLADLNERLDDPINSETFRMNIIVDGAEAYEEESWSKAIVGDVEFSAVKLCDRCRTVNVDIERGERYKNGPLTMLRKYRPLTKENGYRPILGIKYKTVKPGYIKIGDPVYVIQ